MSADKKTRLCILQAGENHPSLLGRVPSYREAFTAMFAPFPRIALTFHKVCEDDFPASLDDCDAFLVTGGTAGVYDTFPWLEKLRTLIREIAATQKPLVGICLGHQLIADTLGGKAALSDKGWGVGLRTVQDKRNGNGNAHGDDKNNAAGDAVGNAAGNAFKLLYVHRDQVMEPPTGAEVIAGDAFCPIAAYRVGDHILAYQGHPEFTPEIVAAIMELRAKDMGADVVAAATPTLHDPHDAPAITKHIAGFIMRRDLTAET